LFLSSLEWAFGSGHTPNSRELWLLFGEALASNLVAFDRPLVLRGRTWR
jgi:hypothetical protein